MCLCIWMCFTAGLTTLQSHPSRAGVIWDIKNLPCHPLTPPHWPPICTQDLWRGCVSALSETEDQEGTRTRWCVSLLHESLCWPAGSHLHSDLQQISGAVWSSFLLEMLYHHPGPQETLHHKIKWLQARRRDDCGHEILGAGPPEGHHRPPAGPSAVWEEWPARSKPEWYFVTGLLCWSWMGHNKCHVPAGGDS